MVLEQHWIYAALLWANFKKYIYTLVLHDLWLVESVDTELCIQRAICKATCGFSTVQIGALNPHLIQGSNAYRYMRSFIMSIGSCDCRDWDINLFVNVPFVNWRSKRAGGIIQPEFNSLRLSLSQFSMDWMMPTLIGEHDLHSVYVSNANFFYKHLHRHTQK